MTPKHRTIEANGIFLHVVEQGEGPSVIFCHGFPAIWSSWRSQMDAVARAGFRAIAPDMRGYGDSSAPAQPEDYTPYQTVGDLVAILDALAAPTAVVVGHDFGANVAWNAADVATGSLHRRVRHERAVPPAGRRQLPGQASRRWTDPVLLIRHDEAGSGRCVGGRRRHRARDALLDRWRGAGGGPLEPV